MTTTTKQEPKNIAPVTNGGKRQIGISEPYAVEVTIQGSTPLLMHRWNVESVAEKASARKGSAAKKSDDVESYVYRNDAGEICMPSEYLRMAIVNAGRFAQDPRSPRKSASDLLKAALMVTPELASLGVKGWDYLDQRRVQVQRNGITRTRPALAIGWKTTFRIEVLLPEYVAQEFLSEIVTMAGRLVGVGDFRPTYGRFNIVQFMVCPATV